MKKQLHPGIIEYRDIKNLHLDKFNSRFPKTLRDSNEEKLLEWMLSNASLLELMVSISENGYFNGEPLLVVPIPNDNNNFIVIEGNRRLSAVKLLNNPEAANRRVDTITEIINSTKKPIPKELPVLIFSSENEILDYLGYRHITGIKQWNPLAKARYLDKLFKARKNVKSLDNKYQILANIIGSKPHYVKRMHTTFRVFEFAEGKGFFNIPGLNEETIEFSNLNDALTKFSYICSYVNIDFTKPDSLVNINRARVVEIFNWLFYRNPETNKTTIGEVRNLPKLNAILNPANEYAYKAFMKGESIEKAYNLTDEPQKLFSKSLNEAFEGLLIAQQLFYSISLPTSEDAKTLKKINELSFDFYNTVISKLDMGKKV